MPLTQQDESWAKLSEGWPEYRDTPEKTKEAYKVAVNFKVVPYGSYVLVEDCLRVETYELLERLLKALVYIDKYGYKRICNIESERILFYAFLEYK